jgi:hypothetical protein
MRTGMSSGALFRCRVVMQVRGMAETGGQLQQAMSAFNAGRKAEARALLEQVVQQDESHESAWLYLSAVVDTLEEQQICLENVLILNPGNDKARKGLEAVKRKLAAQGKASPGPAAPPTGVGFGGPSRGEPTAPAQGIDDPFAWLNDVSATPAARPPAPAPEPGYDPSAPATSVDWGRSDRPAAHGSGRDVEQLSSQEYDDWVQGLNLGNSADAPVPPDTGLPRAAPFIMDDSEAPYGETSYMIEEEPPAAGRSFGADQSNRFGGDPFGGPSSPAPFSGEPAADELPADDSFDSFPAFSGQDTGFGASQPAAFDTGSGPFEVDNAYTDDAAAADDSFGGPFALDSEPSAPSASAGTQARFGAPPEAELAFDFDDDAEGNVEEDTAWMDRLQPASARPAAPALATAHPAASTFTAADYFRVIPGEIEAVEGGITPRSLLLIGAIVILALLNVVSFAALLL